MPVQEEVDEINEFLQKRREKQRLGELPRDDTTPAFAKKISLAIFGKPKEKDKPLLKSTQPTYASTEAQAAIRQQLDEIMDAHVKTTPRPAYSPAAPKNNTPPAPALSTKATAPTPSAPRVPHYYADMPYPPYIQRGLANYAKFKKKNNETTPITATPAPAATPPAPTITPTPSRWPASAKNDSLVNAPPRINIVKTTAPPTRAQPTTPAAATASTLPTSPFPPRTISTSNNSTSASSSTTKTGTTIPLPPARASTAPSISASTPSTKPIPFWKKLFGGKTTNVQQAPANARMISTISPSKPTVTSAIPRTPATPPSSYTPIPSLRDEKKDSLPTNSISSVASTTPASRDTNPLLPVAAPKENVAPFVPEKTIPFSRIETKKNEEVQREKRAELLQSLAPKPMTAIPVVNTRPPSTPPASTAPSSNESAKYVPPWVSRSGVMNASAASPKSTNAMAQNQPPSSDILPWKQPFGTSENMSAGKNMGTKNSASPDLLRDAEKLSREKKISSGEIIFDELEKENMHDTQTIETKPARDAAMEKEISEEEALEKLPFEEVEGLSESDLDYLSRKEKEHRAIQEKEEGDVGDPHALKDTLQRQTSQLEDALQKEIKPANDEKEAILRRLKEMMEDERH